MVPGQSTWPAVQGVGGGDELQRSDPLTHGLGWLTTLPPHRTSPPTHGPEVGPLAPPQPISPSRQLGEGELEAAVLHPTKPSRQVESAEVPVVPAACATTGADGQATTTASGRAA